MRVIVDHCEVWPRGALVADVSLLAAVPKSLASLGAKITRVPILLHPRPTHPSPFLLFAMSQPPSAAAAADSTQLTAPSDSVQPSPPSKCDPNAPGAAALTCLSDLWRGYLRLLMVHPVRTKAITSAVVSSLSAVIAQKTMGVTLDKLNYTAIGHQALLGLIRGPTVHYWYEQRDNREQV